MADSYDKRIAPQDSRAIGFPTCPGGLLLFPRLGNASRKGRRHLARLPAAGIVERVTQQPRRLATERYIEETDSTEGTKMRVM